MIDLLPARRVVISVAAVALVVLLVPAPAPAQIAGPCADDLAKYCSGITPGGGRVKQCLEKRLSDVSPSCRDWLEEMRKKAEDLNRACFEEIAAYCNFDKPDQMRIVQCLNERYVNLRLECREKLREFTDPLRNP